MASVAVQVRTIGPLFGDPTSITERMSKAIVDAVAQQAFADLHEVMNFSFRHPTPYYETQVVNDDHGTFRVIHDRSIVYGPWLEGVSYRNMTTSFKGYHIYERAAESAQRAVETIVDRVAPAYIEMLGG